MAGFSYETFIEIVTKSPTFFITLFFILVGVHYALAPGNIVTLPSKTADNKTIEIVHGSVYGLVMLLVLITLMMMRPDLLRPVTSS